MLSSSRNVRSRFQERMLRAASLHRSSQARRRRMLALIRRGKERSGFTGKLTLLHPSSTGPYRRECHLRVTELVSVCLAQLPRRRPQGCDNLPSFKKPDLPNSILILCMCAFSLGGWVKEESFGDRKRWAEEKLVGERCCSVVIVRSMLSRLELWEAGSSRQLQHTRAAGLG